MSPLEKVVEIRMMIFFEKRSVGLGCPADFQYSVGIANHHFEIGLEYSENREKFGVISRRALILADMPHFLPNVTRCLRN